MAEQVGAMKLLAELLRADDAMALLGAVVDLPADQALAVGRAGVIARRRPTDPVVADAKEREERLAAAGPPEHDNAARGKQHVRRVAVDGQGPDWSLPAKQV